VQVLLTLARLLACMLLFDQGDRGVCVQVLLTLARLLACMLLFDQGCWNMCQMGGKGLGLLVKATAGIRLAITWRAPELCDRNDCGT